MKMTGLIFELLSVYVRFRLSTFIKFFVLFTVFIGSNSSRHNNNENAYLKSNHKAPDSLKKTKKSIAMENYSDIGHRRDHRFEDRSSVSNHQINSPELNTFLENMLKAQDELKWIDHAVRHIGLGENRVESSGSSRYVQTPFRDPANVHQVRNRVKRDSDQRKFFGEEQGSQKMKHDEEEEDDVDDFSRESKKIYLDEKMGIKRVDPVDFGESSKEIRDRSEESIYKRAAMDDLTLKDWTRDEGLRPSGDWIYSNKDPVVIKDNGSVDRWSSNYQALRKNNKKSGQVVNFDNNVDDWMDTMNNNDGNTKNQRDISFLRISTDIKDQFPSGNLKQLAENDMKSEEVPSLEYLKKTVLELSKSLMENGKKVDEKNETEKTSKTSKTTNHDRHVEEMVGRKEGLSKGERERVNMFPSHMIKDSNSAKGVIDDSPEKNVIESGLNWWDDPRSGAEIFNFRRRENDLEDDREDETEAENENSDLDYVMQRVKRAKKDGADEENVKVFYRAGFGESYLDEDLEESLGSKRHRRDSSDKGEANNNSNRRTREAKSERNDDKHPEADSFKDSKNVNNDTNVVDALRNNSKTIPDSETYANDSQKELQKHLENTEHGSWNDKGTLESSSKRIFNPEVSKDVIDVQSDGRKIVKENRREETIERVKVKERDNSTSLTENVNLAGTKENQREDGLVNKDRESILNEKSLQMSKGKLNEISKTCPVELALVKIAGLEGKLDVPEVERKRNVAEESKDSKVIDRNLKNAKEVEGTEPVDEEQKKYLKGIFEDKKSRKKNTINILHEPENGERIENVVVKVNEESEKKRSIANSSIDQPDYHSAKFNEIVMKSNKADGKLTAEDGKMLNPKESKAQLESTKITEDSHTKDESNEEDKMKPREVPNIDDRKDDKLVVNSESSEKTFLRRNLNDNEVQIENETKLKRERDEKLKDMETKNEQLVESNRANGADLHEVLANDKDAIVLKSEIAVISSRPSSDLRDEKMVDKDYKKHSTLQDWYTDLKYGLREGFKEPGWYMNLVRNEDNKNNEEDTRDESKRFFNSEEDNSKYKELRYRKEKKNEGDLFEDNRRNSDYKQNRQFSTDGRLDSKGNDIENSGREDYYDGKVFTKPLNDEDKIKYEGEKYVYEDKYENDKRSANDNRKEPKYLASTMMEQSVQLKSDETKERDSRDVDKDEGADKDSKESIEKGLQREDMKRKLLWASSSTSESDREHKDPEIRDRRRDSARSRRASGKFEQKSANVEKNVKEPLFFEHIRGNENEMNENSEIRSRYETKRSAEGNQDFKNDLQRNDRFLMSIKDMGGQLAGRYRLKRRILNEMDSDLGMNFGSEEYLNVDVNPVKIQKRSNEVEDDANAVNYMKLQDKSNAEGDEEKEDILAEESEERPFRRELTLEKDENDYRVANDNAEEIVQDYDEGKEEELDDTGDEGSLISEREERSPLDEMNERNILKGNVDVLIKEKVNPSNEEKYLRRRRHPIGNIEYYDYNDEIGEHEINAPAVESNEQKSNQLQNITANSKNEGAKKEGYNKNKPEENKNKGEVVLKDENAEEEMKQEKELKKLKNKHPKQEFIADITLPKPHKNNKTSSAISPVKTKFEPENEELNAEFQRVRQEDAKARWSGQPLEVDTSVEEHKKNMEHNVEKGGTVLTIPLEYSVNMRGQLGPETVGVSIGNGPSDKEQIRNRDRTAHAEHYRKDDDQKTQSNDMKPVYEELERVNEWGDGEVKKGLRLRGDQRMYDEVKEDFESKRERPEAHDDRPSRRSWYSKEPDRVNIEGSDIDESFSSHGEESRYNGQMSKGRRFLKEVRPDGKSRLDGELSPDSMSTVLDRSRPVEPVAGERTYFVISPLQSSRSFNPNLGSSSSSSGSNYQALKITDDMFKGGIEQSNPTEEKPSEAMMSDKTTTEWKVIKLIDAKNNSLLRTTIIPTLIDSRKTAIVQTDSRFSYENSENSKAIISDENYEDTSRNKQSALSSKEFMHESFIEPIDWYENFNNDVNVRLGRGLKAAEDSSILILKSNEIRDPKLIQERNSKYSRNESYFEDPEEKNIIEKKLKYFSYPVDGFERKIRVKKQLTNVDWEEPPIQKYLKNFQNGNFHGESTVTILNEVGHAEYNDGSEMNVESNVKRNEDEDGYAVTNLKSDTSRTYRHDSNFIHEGTSKINSDQAKKLSRLENRNTKELNNVKKQETIISTGKPDNDKNNDKLSARKKRILNNESGIFIVPNQMNLTVNLRNQVKPSKTEILSSTMDLEKPEDKNSSRVKRDTPYHRTKYKIGNFGLRSSHDKTDLDYRGKIYNPVQSWDTNRDWHSSLHENSNSINDYRKLFGSNWRDNGRYNNFPQDLLRYSQNNYGKIVGRSSESKRFSRQKTKENHSHSAKYDDEKGVHVTNLNRLESSVFKKDNHHQHHSSLIKSKNTSDKILSKTLRNHSLKSSLNGIVPFSASNDVSHKKHGGTEANRKTLPFAESNKIIEHRVVPMTGTDKRVQHENAQDQTTVKQEDESQKKKLTVLLAVDNMEDESQMDLALHGELAGKIVEKIFEQVQRNQVLKIALGPGLYRRNRPEDSIMSDKIFRQGLDEDEVKHTEVMMRRVMELLGRLILDEVQRKTCASLPPDMHEFLRWMLGVEQEENLSDQVPPLPLIHNQDISRCPGDKFLFHEHSEFDLNVDVEELYKKVRLLKNLINEYNALTEREKTKVQTVHDYLVKHLGLLVKYIEEKEDEEARRKENVIHYGNIGGGNILQYQSPMSNATNASRAELLMATLSPLVNTPSILRLSNATFTSNEGQSHLNSKFDRVKHREIRSSGRMPKRHHKRKHKHHKHKKHHKHGRHKHETPEYKKLLRRVAVLRKKRANLYEDTWDPFDSGYEEPAIYSSSGVLTNAHPEHKESFWDEALNILEDRKKYKDEVDKHNPHFWVDVSSGKLENANGYNLKKISGSRGTFGNSKKRTVELNEKAVNTRGHYDVAGFKTKKSDFRNFKGDNLEDKEQKLHVFDYGGKGENIRGKNERDTDEFYENFILNLANQERKRINVDSDLRQSNGMNSAIDFENPDETVASDSSKLDSRDFNMMAGYVKRKRETLEKDENSSEMNRDSGRKVKIKENDEIVDKSEIRKEIDTSGLRIDNLTGSSELMERKKDISSASIDLQPWLKPREEEFTSKFIKKPGNQLIRPSNEMSSSSSADKVMEREVKKRNASNDYGKKSVEDRMLDESKEEDEKGKTSVKERNLAEDEVILLNKREVWKKKNEQQLEEVAFGKDMRGMPMEKEQYKRLIEMDKKKSEDDVGVRMNREDEEDKVEDSQKSVDQHEASIANKITTTPAVAEKEEQRQGRPELKNKTNDDVTLELRVYEVMPVNSTSDTQNEQVSRIHVEFEKKNDYLKKLENKINVFPNVDEVTTRGSEKDVEEDATIRNRKCGDSSLETMKKAYQEDTTKSNLELITENVVQKNDTDKVSLMKAFNEKDRNVHSDRGPINHENLKGNEEAVDVEMNKISRLLNLEDDRIKDVIKDQKPGEQ